MVATPHMVSDRTLTTLDTRLILTAHDAYLPMYMYMCGYNHVFGRTEWLNIYNVKL